MNRRAAVTLTEVLIAIFIMGIGLMAILSLFPLGAAQMAQALKDQRCAELAGNASALFRTLWKEACEIGGQSTPTTQQRFIMALTDPNKADTQTPDPLGGPPAPPYGITPVNSGLFFSASGRFQTPVSYPVLVDTIGWQANTGSAQQWWVGGKTPNLPYAVPRRPLYIRRQAVTTTGQPPNQITTVSDVYNLLTNFGTQRVLRYHSLLDDLTFQDDGTPAKVANAVDRQGRYSFAYLVRRDDNRIGRRIHLYVVVYSGRSADVATDETPYLVSGLAPGGGDKEVVINYTGRPKPALRRGWWLMDGTMGYTTTVNGATVFVPTPQGYFYRVVNVNDDTPNQLIVELQTPTQPLAPLPTTAAGVQRLFVVMDNVVEVFDKGQIDWKEEPHPF